MGGRAHSCGVFMESTGAICACAAWTSQLRAVHSVSAWMSPALDHICSSLNCKHALSKGLLLGRARPCHSYVGALHRGRESL